MAKWAITDFADLRIKYGFTSIIESVVSARESRELKLQLKVLF
jgi:hypothetical protein